VVTHVRNDYKANLGIEESYKKRFPIKALPNNGNILCIVCCIDNGNGLRHIRMFENSLWSYTMLVWHDFCAVGFLERKATPIKVYKKFGDSNFED
jgi:hypothetical protein